jgi:hypothetical protein
MFEKFLCFMGLFDAFHKAPLKAFTQAVWIELASYAN